eukprot:g5851.t1
MPWITTTIMLERLSDAQDSAWEELATHFRAPVHHFAIRLGLNESAAEDVVQSTLLAFISAYRDGRYEKDRGRLSSWLFGIAYRESLQVIRCARGSRRPRARPVQKRCIHREAPRPQTHRRAPARVRPGGDRGMNGDDLERLERYDQGLLSDDERDEVERRLRDDHEFRAMLEDVREASALSQQLRSSGMISLPRRMPCVSGYAIERELHSGGQGVVFAATQLSTGRRVAIKVLLAGKAASHRQQQRLEREIDLAASISHPGVVTVFDRAETDDGRPALVMELIDGRPLNVYLREESLGSDEVLKLVAQISGIVNAAHQRGVIHRDLKPSNILIGADANPRILDFGLAKALEPDAPQSLVTHEGEFMGTLAYAGPEQVERGAIAADIRSDVYALGAILGEALTGQLPIDVSGPIASAIGRIRETPPTPPSSVRAGLDPDIDTIVLTAMAKEPQRRYQSAAAFAGDIERFLNDEPILARQASTMYQLRKFARRNRALVSAVCIAMIALTVGAAAISVALVRTNAANARTTSAKDAAVIDADKQARMNRFLRRMLTAVEPGNAGPELKVVDLLSDAEGRIETEFADYPALRAALHATLGETYWRLGLLEPAHRHQTAAVGLLQALGSDAPSGDLPAAISELGAITHSRGDLDTAGALHTQSIELWEASGLHDDPRRMRAFVNAAALHAARGDTQDAERLYQLALDGLPSGDAQSRILRAQALVSLGALYRPMERYGEARAAYDRALPILRELRGPEHPDTLACLGNSAEVLVSLGEHEQAESQMRDLIKIRRRVFGQRHERVAIAINNLADFLREQDRADDAVPLFEEAISIFSESLGARHSRVAMASHNLGLTLTRSGRPADALPYLQDSFDILSGTVPPTHWILAQMRLSLGEAYLGLGRIDLALPLIRGAHDGLLEQFGPDHSRTRRANELLGAAEASLASADPARSLWLRGLIRPLAVLVAVTAGAELAAAQQSDPGVTLRLFEVAQDLTEIPALAPDQTPNVDQLRDSIDFRFDDLAAVSAPFVTHVVAQLVITTPGEYRFRLTSDDGSRFTLGGAVVIDNDGRHGAVSVDSDPVRLDSGALDLFVEHFDHVGDRVLRLEWRPPGASGFAPIPTDHLRAERDLTRVTSPGVKRVEGGRRPGDRAPLIDVHPAWTLSTIRPPGYEPKVGAMAFLPDGRLVIGTFDPLQRDDRELPDIELKQPDALYALANLDADDPSRITRTRIASDLYEPTGLCVVDGVLYVANRRGVERLLDTDDDGFFETHQIVGQGWEAWNYHQFAFGLLHRDGKLYTALSTAMAPPGWEGMKENAGPNGPMRGGIVEIDIDNGDTRVIAGGVRTPNGLGFTADGAMIYLDNQGTWMPCNQLTEIIPGRFYGHYNWTSFVPNLAERFPSGGHPSVLSDRPRTPAAVLMPQNEVTNSPTQPLVIESGPFEGQLLVGELTAGGIRRVMLERVNGQLQGALFRFTQGLESGVNRMAWGPDGALFIGGIGAGGNWNWRGTQFGLQRLTPNGADVFEMHSVHAAPDGFRVRFTEPVNRGWLADPGNFTVTSWTYEPTDAYGGPKIDQRTHSITSATPTPDGRSVHLVVDAFEAGRCYALVTDPVSADGDSIWSTEAWYTLNVIPRAEASRASTIAGVPIEPTSVGVGVLPPDGAVTLTGRNTAAAMRSEGKPYPPEPVTQDQISAGQDFIAVGEGSGDLVSTTEFADARLHVEWLSPPGGSGQMGGNSGIYLQGRYEIQVLNTPKGENPPAINEAGAIYNIKRPDANASAGPGAWQAYDIWFRAPRFKDGTKTEDARVSVYWNGVLIHDDVTLPHGTGSQRAIAERPAEGLSVQVGPLRLQDHVSGAEGPVRYRNVWIAPLADSRYAPGAWTNLLTSTTDDDWMIRGGRATYERADGVLKGTSTPRSPNSFYTTRATYADFELVYEARVDPRLNSGVQIRSHVIGGPDNRAGGLRGYQIEIDPAARSYSAGIYDEQRRGWLHPLHAAEYARRAFRPGEWNEFRVVATGPVIRTWINGVPAAEIFDAATPEGHIGFQVHDVGSLEDPLQIRFRNARIRTLIPELGAD